MDNSILRGFCQDCENPWTMEQYEAMKEMGYTPCMTRMGKQCELVWFLSPQQMIKVEQSKIYIDWKTKHRKQLYGFPNNMSYFLENEPFLVARILKESETE